MTIEAYGIDARGVLSGVGWSVLDASEHVGSVPGLYSIHAAAEAWGDLGLDVAIVLHAERLSGASKIKNGLLGEVKPIRESR